MTQLKKIIQRIQELQSVGEKCALATVVNVYGSAYRRPGARMLFSTKGREAGFVSAACMEADLFEKVKEVLATGKSALFSYDTTAPEDAIFGIGQGCGGYVEILVEPINSEPSDLLSLLRIADEQKEVCSLTTVFRTSDAEQLELGTTLLIKNNGDRISFFNHLEIYEDIIEITQQALKLERSIVKQYKSPKAAADVFVQSIHPPLSLIIFGATPDVKPLVQLSVQLGWDVSIVDHRSAYMVKENYPEAENVLLLSPEEYQEKLHPTPRTYAVIMIHQFEAEAAALRYLFTSQVKYIGLLGPKSKSDLLLQHLASNGFTPTDEQIIKLHNPVGLDIGAESAEEIALSITAEILAIANDREPGFLKYRQGAIH